MTHIAPSIVQLFTVFAGFRFVQRLHAPVSARPIHVRRLRFPPSGVSCHLRHAATQGLLARCFPISCVLFRVSQWLGRQSLAGGLLLIYA